MNGEERTTVQDRERANPRIHSTRFGQAPGRVAAGNPRHKRAATVLCGTARGSRVVRASIHGARDRAYMDRRYDIRNELKLTSARSSKTLFARLSLLLRRMPMRASVWCRRASIASM